MRQHNLNMAGWERNYQPEGDSTLEMEYPKNGDVANAACGTQGLMGMGLQLSPDSSNSTR